MANSRHVNVRWFCDRQVDPRCFVLPSTDLQPEFPDIQIDCFRKNPARPPPLACFLSHVHSDHLQGLESFRAPFIYCSPATRELLLRIEKYPHRMNFRLGILESRRLHYKHLGKLLRPIPLNTPTEIELTPRRHIRVTLFDANHCTGAVLFLIEGDGKAILYTGDIRAEPWWISSLVRHPLLIPYTLGRKRLDKLYLDTTFARAGNANPFREFPTKAEGLAELLQKVEAYSDDTIFYFRSWTFGYEEVWLALAAALNTKVHVDRYQLGLYRSLATIPSTEAPALCGFRLGNRLVAGCLTDDESSRIHSCEPGLSCSAANGANTVYITPIVNRSHDGVEIPEVGAGGGMGDLYQTHELELPDESTLADLQNLCRHNIHDQQLLTRLQDALREAFQSKRKVLPLDQYGVQEEGTIPLETLVTKLSQGVSKDGGTTSKTDLPRSIRFPYSRHSSYAELCELVAAFRPKNVHPCTVDPSSWNEDVSMQHLFGHLCSGSDFSHDSYMRGTLEDTHYEDHQARKRARYEEECSTQSTEDSSFEACNAGLTQIDPKSELRDAMQQAIEPPAQPGGAQQPSSLHVQASSSSPVQKSVRPANQPADVPHTTDRVHAKQNEVRNAHRYLQEHAEPGLLEIGPIPPSWPPAKEHDWKSKPSPEAEGATASQHTSSTKQGFLASGDGACSPQPASQPQDSQLTDSLTLSLSESVIAPHSPRQDGASNRQDPGDEAMHTKKAARARLMARLRARTAAYLAAQESSYSAWADISLVSAGDNHNEKEEEL